MRLALALLFAFAMLAAPVGYAAMDITPEDPPALIGKPFKDKAVKEFAKRLKTKAKPDGNRAYFSHKGDDVGIIFYLDGADRIIEAISINVARFPGTIYGIDVSNAHVLASRLGGAIAGQSTQFARPEAVVEVFRSEDNYGVTDLVSNVTFSAPIPVPESPPRSPRAGHSAPSTPDWRMPSARTVTVVQVGALWKGRDSRSLACSSMALPRGPGASSPWVR